MITEQGVTLLELLRFYAEEYVSLAKHLYELEILLHMDQSEAKYQEDKNPWLTEDVAYSALVALELTKRRCETIGLEVCSKHVAELTASVRQDNRLDSSDVKALHENIERELSCRFFVGIAPNRIILFTKSLTDWEAIAKAFPEATEDIEEMNKCYALCRYSASVFHSLLVVEYGLVRLGTLIGVTDPKEGWDASCKKLDGIIKAGRNANTTKLDFNFLDQGIPAYRR